VAVTYEAGEHGRHQLAFLHVSAPFLVVAAGSPTRPAPARPIQLIETPAIPREEGPRGHCQRPEKCWRTLGLGGQESRGGRRLYVSPPGTPSQCSLVFLASETISKNAEKLGKNAGQLWASAKTTLGPAAEKAEALLGCARDPMSGYHSLLTEILCSIPQPSRSHRQESSRHDRT
jgi:hypothetical protein